MDWAIKIGYAVMVFAIIMCFIFSKRGEKEMRHMVDRFAQAFCKLSNYVLPGGKAPAATLAARKKDGVMQALPAAEQPEELQKLMKRGTARHLAELYGQMEEASAELVYRCRRHRRNRELFADPIRQICYLTSLFRRAAPTPRPSATRTGSMPSRASTPTSSSTGPPCSRGSPVKTPSRSWS